MKKYLRATPLFALLLSTLYFSGCKKCFTCHDICMMCLHSYPYPDTITRFDTLTQMNVIVGIDTVTRIDTAIVCTDFFNAQSEYDSALSQHEAAAYNCFSIPPMYTHDYCVSKSGEDQYMNYYNRGGTRPCDPK